MDLNIKVSSQKRIKVEGGDVLHILNSKESDFKIFHEAYFSIIKSNYIKGWKLHKEMTMNLIVPIGNVQFIFYSEKGELLLNKTIGEHNYCRLTVPPNIWFGFKGLSNKDSLILNIADMLHNPEEVERKSLDSFPFIKP